MENTRRSFLKKMTVAGIGTAGLAVANHAVAANLSETQAATCTTDGFEFFMFKNDRRPGMDFTRNCGCTEQ